MRDSVEGRYELALLKHLWFHRHATKIRPSLSGVRRSYALSAWTQLCGKYAPAHAALLRVRNSAARAVWKDRDHCHAFHDFVSINEHLAEEQLTAALFSKLDRRSPKLAKQVYSLAEPALIRAGDYRLCGKYLEPSDRFSRIRKTYRVNLRLAKDPSIGPDHIQFAQRSFADKATRLIALLSLNGRVDEAKRIGRRARGVWDNDEFHFRIACAERGEFA